MLSALLALLNPSTVLTGAGATALAGAPAAEPGQTEAARGIDLPALVLPVAENGRLRRYLFTSLRLDVAPGKDLWRNRERVHFLRDAIVRASHRNPLTSAEQDAIAALALAAANSAVEAGTFTAAVVLSVDAGGDL
jgi:hypothetical protein